MGTGLIDGRLIRGRKNDRWEEAGQTGNRNRMGHKVKARRVSFTGRGREGGMAGRRGALARVTPC